MRKVLLLVFLLVLCSGCATVGLQDATIRQDQISGPQKEIPLVLQIHGEGVGYSWCHQASAWEETQYFNSLLDSSYAAAQHGSSFPGIIPLPPSSEGYVNIYPFFKQAVVTGAKLAFRNVITEENKNKKKFPLLLPDYKLQALLLNASVESEVQENVRQPKQPYIVISYYVELLDKADTVLATKNGEVKGFSPGGVCNKAGLEITNWTKAEIDKIPPKTLEDR